MKYMLGFRKKEASLLLFGDFLVLVGSVWLALYFRYFTPPAGEFYLAHLEPFLLLSVFWVLVFYISGLYEKHTLVFKMRLPSLILKAQITNSLIAVIFFYTIPYFSITPKTILFLYLVFSFLLLVGWRLFLSERLFRRTPANALLIGEGEEVEELAHEVNENPRHRFVFTTFLTWSDLEQEDARKIISKKIREENISMVVADFDDKKISKRFHEMYQFLLSKVQFFDIDQVYEETFDRVPVSLLNENWLLKKVSRDSKSAYDIVKRGVDIIFGFVFGVLSLVFYPFVILAIKLDDGGKVFLVQERVGKSHHPVKLLKFRTMSYDDSGKWEGEKKNHVTRVGKYLRKTRVDELPQLWNVLLGDISLIGPRPEFFGPVKEYEQQLPYYSIRHILKPGLSGWAQTHHHEHPHHELDVEETKRKLSYDLYYIKNRSLMLDVKIILQTIRILLSRSGR